MIAKNGARDSVFRLLYLYIIFRIRYQLRATKILIDIKGIWDKITFYMIVFKFCKLITDKTSNFMLFKTS